MNLSRIAWMLAITATITTASAQRPPRGGDRRPAFVPPVFAALDTDHDQVLSAAEIERAADTLAKFDKNKDGEITLDEFHKPPSNEKRPPKDEPNARPPVLPVIAALDTDRDGFISAGEMEDATESLKTLDKNNDGTLSPEELHPHRPRPDGPPPESDAEIE